MSNPKHIVACEAEVCFQNEHAKDYWKTYIAYIPLWFRLVFDVVYDQTIFVACRLSGVLISQKEVFFGCMR